MATTKFLHRNCHFCVEKDIFQMMVTTVQYLKNSNNARRIYDAIFQTSGDVKFNPSAWCDIRRFIVPLLGQPSSVTGFPEGCGSCRMAIVFAIRDVCNENTEPFS